MEKKVSQVCASRAMTPVTHRPPVFHSETISPFQMWKTMNGNVWISASTNMAHAIQLCQTTRFSWDVPIKLATGFALVPRILFGERSACVFNYIYIYRGSAAQDEG